MGAGRRPSRGHSDAIQRRGWDVPVASSSVQSTSPFPPASRGPRRALHSESAGLSGVTLSTPSAPEEPLAEALLELPPPAPPPPPVAPLDRVPPPARHDGPASVRTEVASTFGLRLPGPTAMRTTPSTALSPRHLLDPAVQVVTVDASGEIAIYFISVMTICPHERRLITLTLGFNRYFGLFRRDRTLSMRHSRRDRTRRPDPDRPRENATFSKRYSRTFNDGAPQCRLPRRRARARRGWT